MNINNYLKKSNIEFKHLLSLTNVSEDEINQILSTASELKNMRLVHENLNNLKDKYILLVTKPTLPRSAITFQIAIKELSGEPIITSLSGEQLEDLFADEHSVKALLSCGVSAVIVCTSKSSDSIAFKNSASVPIMNATAIKSPCEALSTFMTIAEKTPNFKNLKVTLVGDFNSDDNSLITGLVKLGCEVIILPCENGQPSDKVLTYLSQYSDVKIVKDKIKALKDADYIYFSENLGEIDISKEDLSFNEKYKILSSVPLDKKLVESNLIEDATSLIDKQTENLLHVGKALLLLLMNK